MALRAQRRPALHTLQECAWREFRTAKNTVVALCTAQICVAHCREIVSKFYFRTNFACCIPQLANFTLLKQHFKCIDFYGLEGEF